MRFEDPVNLVDRNGRQTIQERPVRCGKISEALTVAQGNVRAKTMVPSIGGPGEEGRYCRLAIVGTGLIGRKKAARFVTDPGCFNVDFQDVFTQ